MNILDRCEELEAEAHALRCEDASPDDLRTAARWLEEYYAGRIPRAVKSDMSDMSDKPVASSSKEK